MYGTDILNALRKNKISIGDRITFTVQGKEYEGILMPRPETGDDSTLIIKQDDGYNVGIKYHDGTILKIESKKAEGNKKSKNAKMEADQKLPKVTLLYTGGTIGSKIDYLTGGVRVLTTPSELLGEIPELAGMANIEVKDLMHTFSEDISHTEWSKIAEAAETAFNTGSVGVVITMGTDTMHYTSAALSFMLQNIPGPVVITGAQRSSDRGSSDAFTNLACAVAIAAQGKIAEVGICMHSTSSDKQCSFIRGTKVRKMHTSRRDAFKPINSTVLATVDIETYKVEYGEECKKTTKKTAKSYPKFESKVALIKMYPNADPKIIDFYVEKGYKGIILEGTGLGHVAINTVHKEYSWAERIRNAIGKGVIIGMTSQCLSGRVNPNVYSTARTISEMGVTYCEDMLPEVALVKLGWLLANHTRKEVKEQLSKDIVGEISSRITYKEM